MYTCICTHIDIHTLYYLMVYLHVQVYVCVYTVIFQIYLSAIVIELIVLIDKSEFSPRCFLSFSKATNKKKNVPTPFTKRSMNFFVFLWSSG